MFRVLGAVSIRPPRREDFSVETPSFQFLVALAATLRRVPDHDLDKIRQHTAERDHELVLAVVEREVERRREVTRRRVPCER